MIVNWENNMYAYKIYKQRVKVALVHEKIANQRNDFSRLPWQYVFDVVSLFLKLVYRMMFYIFFFHITENKNH